MKKIYPLLLLFCAVAQLGFSQTFQWARSFEGISASSAVAVTVDATGNVITTGYFNDTVDFDPSAGTFDQASEGFKDIFVSKLDPFGNFLWAIRIGGALQDIGGALATDAAGNIYLAGQFTGTVDFDPGPGTYNLLGNGSTDVFVAKFDSSGTLLWVDQFGGALDEDVNALTLNDLGNICLTGYFRDTIDFDPGIGTFHLTSAGYSDIFVVTLNPTGNLVWATSMGGTNWDHGFGIDTDTANNIYLSGDFIGTIDFDPGIGTYNLTTPNSVTDVYVLKLDVNGNFIWAKRMGATSPDLSRSLVLDPSGNILMTGLFLATVDFDPGPGIFNLTASGSADAYIWKLDAQGNFIWARQLYGYAGEEAYSIKTDALGSVYLVGGFNDPVDFDPGVGTYQVANVLGYDAYLLKLDAAGLFSWVGTWGGNGPEKGLGVFVDQSANVYTAGYFRDLVDLDFGASTYNLNAGSMDDAFIQKIGQCLTPPAPSNTTALNQQTICAGSSTTLTATGFGTVHWYASPSGGPVLATGTSFTTPILTTTTTYYAEDSMCLAGPRLGITVTVNLPTFATITAAACDSFTSPRGQCIWTNSGVYSDSIPNAMGCDSVITINLTVTTVDATVTISLPTLVANAANAAYQWIYCDSVAILGETNQSFAPTANGNYAVIVTQNGCSDTSACEAVVVIGVAENESGFRLYPNPTAGKVQLEWLGKTSLAIQVRNALGQIVHRQFLEGVDHLALELNGPTGVYFLELRSEDEGMACFKVVKW